MSSSTIRDEESELGRRKLSRLTKQPWNVKNPLVKSMVQLAAIFFASALILAVAYVLQPPFTDEERAKLRIPKSFNDTRVVGEVLKRYATSNFWSLSTAYCMLFIFLQSFSIPGCSFLSILAGFLFNEWFALFAICASSTIGCTFCYLLSASVALELVNIMFKEKLEPWREKARRNRTELWSYFIFLRTAPILPAWFINITSPIIEIPLKVFCVGTFVGVVPQNFCFIQAGKELHKLLTLRDTITWKNGLLWVSLLLLSLLPLLIKRCFKSRYGIEEEKKTIVSSTTN